ncbi:hypothetical protein CMV_028005 [Castanea mollissima]|uniref:Uncharacterized protein n=1 Tax=Castanea mollissima TaxID=60419 RepID=A0A8J4V8U4_9ROSI|nr:hypothetical protein CMV_028005 [Castanea mollissima]
MGAETFDGRVRDGIGSCRLAKATRPAKIVGVGEESVVVFGSRRARRRVGADGHGLMRAIKPNERLVPVSFTRRRAFTSGLSTWWSSTALQGELVSRLAPGPAIRKVEGGFPHSEIPGSKLVRSSPRLIAAYHTARSTEPYGPHRSSAAANCVPDSQARHPLSGGSRNSERQVPKNGGARRDRTDDLMLAKHALSQLSYGPKGSAPADRTSRVVVGLGRLERPTSPLSGVRSNHLSYRPRAIEARRPAKPKRSADRAIW